MAVAKTLRAILTGEPSIAGHEPDAYELYRALTQLEIQAGLSGKSFWHDTLSSLNAATGAVEDDTGYVLDDGANTGVYRRGVSTWARTADLPGAFSDSIGALAAVDVLSASIDDKADAATVTAALATKADDAATTAALALKATTVALTAEENARKAAETIRLTSAASADGLAYTATSPVTLVAGSRFTLRTPAIANAGNCTLAATGLSPATIRSRDNQNLLAGMLQASTQYDFVVDSASIVRCLGLSRAETDKVVVLESTTGTNTATLAAQALEVGALQKQVLTIASPSFANADPFTRSGFGAPTAVLAPVASVIFVEVDGVKFARMTDLTSAEFIINNLRDVVTIRPNTTYRVTVQARLVGATVLGTSQARVQINRLDGSYGLLDSTATAVNLTGSWQTFTVEWTSGSAPTAVYFRASFFKMNTYTDATGAVDIRELRVSDMTNGAELPQRVAALEESGSASGGPAMIPPITIAMTAPVPSGVPARQPIYNSSAGWFALQPSERMATVINTVASPKYDLSYMITDSVAYVHITSTTAKFYAGAGKTFEGSIYNTLDVVGPGLVIITKVLTRLSVVVLSGTPTYSNPVAPVMAQTNLVAGQSNANNWFIHGGIGGFNRACRDAAWMTLGVIDPEAHWINGSTGGTALLKSHVSPGATNWWYDAATTDHGPALTTCLAAIDTAIAAGQPVPLYMFWSQGETDVFALENGTTTMTAYKDAIKIVWGIIRDHLVTKGAVSGNIRFILMAMGANEPGPLRRVGGSRVRQAYALAVAETAYAYRGIQTFDSDRAPNDIHHTALGYDMEGRRLARAYAKAVSGTAYDLGPVASGAVLADDKRTVTVTLTSGGTLSMPPGLHDQGVTLGRDPSVLGGAPLLMGLVKGDGGLIKINRVAIGASTLTLTADADIPAGTVLHYPFGYCPEHRLRDFVTDTQEDVAVGVPGLPLQDFAIAL